MYMSYPELSRMAACISDALKEKLLVTYTYSFRYMQKVIMHTNIVRVWQYSTAAGLQHCTACGERGQWWASIGGACSLGTMAAPRHSNVEKLLQKIEESQIGYNSTLQGPFGIKRGTCMIA